MCSSVQKYDLPAVVQVSSDLWYICMFILFFVLVDMCDGQETFTDSLYGNYQETIQWSIDTDININTDSLFSVINAGEQGIT